jgi:signal transduction histidine kinase
VVWNLTENAIKNTERGRVDLCAYASDAAVVIEVRDTGVGLPPDTEARAFDRFYRDRARGFDGFGLGLSIAHQAALALGGDLRLERRQGGGTTARLCLPSRRLRLRQGAAEASRFAETRALGAA